MEKNFITNLMVSKSVKRTYDKKEVKNMKEIIKKAKSDEGAELKYNTELHVSIDENSFYAYVCEKGNREMVYVVYSGFKNKDSMETVVDKTIKKIRENHVYIKYQYTKDQYEDAPCVVEIINNDTYYRKMELFPWLIEFYNIFCFTIIEEWVA